MYFAIGTVFKSWLSVPIGYYFEMGVFKNWQGSQRVIHLSIIRLIVWLGWVSNIALAQMELSQAVTGSVEFHGINLACMGNLAVFVTSLLRGRLDLEMGARDVLATMRGPKLVEINNGFGLTTCKAQEYDKASVVMLSLQTPNLSIRQFMKYISNAYNVHSIILQCFPVNSPVLDQKFDGEQKNHSINCKCIVFSTVEEVIILLADQIPRTLKRLSDSLFLLPSEECLAEGCHGCKQDLLYVEHDKSGKKTLKKGDSKSSEDRVTEVKRSAVLKTLEILQTGEYNCICIPLCPSGYDYWTKLLSRSLGVKDTESAVENFSTASLIAPRLAEVFVNIALTLYFRIDGFSSSLVARRAIRDYVVDSKGSGFGANAFLTKAESKVEVDSETKYVCHVLTFRGTLASIRTFSFGVCIFNVFCCISGVLLIALNGRLGNWYDSHPFTLDKGRVVGITALILVISGMDCWHLYKLWKDRDTSSSTPEKEKFRLIATVMVLVVFIFELIWVGAGIAIVVTSGVKRVKVDEKWSYKGVNGSDKWFYSLYILVWIKWAVGSFLLGEYPPEYDSEFDYGNGILVYSSAFLLNSALAGARSNWQYSLTLEDTTSPAASPSP